MDLQALRSFYEEGIRGMWGITYGGTLRSAKASLVETLAERLIRGAWTDVGGEASRLHIDARRYSIGDGKGHRYALAQDKHVYVDGEFVLSVECKSYAEVAMYKRILVDCHLMATRFPKLKFCLFQLESMLGGDYSLTTANPQGSDSVLVLNHYFPDVHVTILTLLDGERSIRRPIHQERFFKPMPLDRLAYAYQYFTSLFRPLI